MNNDLKDLSGMVSIKELATMYYPKSSVLTASRNFRREIRGYPSLIAQLQQAGFKERQRYLTPRQTELILQYLGDPL